ncbi:MAG: SLC13 family permease [Alphaproteobacteria bacterium]|jgi:di/tricarboxylate transporter|nr:SLC13 family permease [Alphaproteobacteria bacterium]
MIAADPFLLMWLTLALAGIVIIAYAHPRLPLELTSVGLVAALLILFHVAPLRDSEGAVALDAVSLLKGFGNPAIITVVALLIVGQGMVRAGALEMISQTIYRAARGRPAPAIALSLVVALTISAALNNTPVVVMFIPVLASLADRLGHTASSVMMPLSYCTILGGMMTLIGSSTNLLVAGTAVELGMAPLGFFDFAIPGAVLAALGFLYVLFVAPRLMPKRETGDDEPATSSGKQFIAQFTVEPQSQLIGIAAVGGMFPALREMTVLMVQRGAVHSRAPFEDIALEQGDVVIVAATRKALIDAVSPGSGLQIRPTEASEDDTVPADEAAGDAPPDSAPGADRVVAEAMVSPGSRLLGLPIEQSAFPAADGVRVVGVQRRSRMTRAHMHEVRLQAGDVLLVSGRSADVRGLRANRDVVLMQWSESELPSYHHARRASLIFLAVVAIAASGVLPIVAAAVAGAALMVFSGALNIRQAARAIDRQIILVGGGALALNAALSATGGGSYIAGGLVEALDGAGAAVMLSGFFLLVAVFTNVLSNNACAVLFTPIGVNIAVGLGIDPTVFIIAVILAANCSFASPIGYVTNLLVMTPGRYRFSDFVRAGSPLILLLWIGFSLFAPWYYGLW